MRPVPWWVLLSSVCAPVLLVGGWAISAVLQGPGYDHASRTISILASKGADGFWVMTSALIALGGCHVITACGLRSAALPGRVALGGGGVSAMLLALFPAPSRGGSLDHGAVVAVGFALLAVWPILAVQRGAAGQLRAAARRGTAGRQVSAARSDTTGRRRATERRPMAVPLGGSAPWGLRSGPSFTATALMWVGGVWFLMALFAHDTAGVAERVLTFAQSFWPLVVVVSCVRQTDASRP
ncbi:DUF998 domain-containing protein [Streptomyces sp. NPDC060035]|uniref:DUF998 domain-containing protein n=1 Tax=Streptomyces sp. NPDC060035 TaxID=3347044 RepID=UPI0036995301